MMNDRYEKGLEILNGLVGKDILSQTVEHVARFSPDMAQYVVEFAFGEIYSRPALDMKQKELLTIASLVTQGAVGQLDFHLNAALNVGLTPEEIVEAVIHCIPYVGFPKSLSALQAVMEVFKGRGIDLSREVNV